MSDRLLTRHHDRAHSSSTPQPEKSREGSNGLSDLTGGVHIDICAIEGQPRPSRLICRLQCEVTAIEEAIEGVVKTIEGVVTAMERVVKTIEGVVTKKQGCGQRVQRELKGVSP
jgi:hypothetical protein